MKLILNTYNPAELDGFSYAFVDIDVDLARLILQRREVFRRVHASAIEAGIDGDALACMEYRDYSAIFLCGIPDSTSLENTDNGGDFDETTLTPEDLENYAERTDCDRMCITSDYVYWTAYPHHSDRALTVETSQIDFATVESVRVVAA